MDGRVEREHSPVTAQAAPQRSDPCNHPLLAVRRSHCGAGAALWLRSIVRRVHLCIGPVVKSKLVPAFVVPVLLSCSIPVPAAAAVVVVLHRLVLQTGSIPVPPRYREYIVSPECRTDSQLSALGD